MKKVVSITRLVLNSIFFLGGIALILLGTGALDGLVKNPVISLKDDTIGTYIKVHYGIGDISFSKPEIILGILISLLSLTGMCTSISMICDARLQKKQARQLAVMSKKVDMIAKICEECNEEPSRDDGYAPSRGFAPPQSGPLFPANAGAPVYNRNTNDSSIPY
ncbi:MAG: hypothetical protein CW338_07265 [Clostridiales bacterium]|nr:hypothetical protein [Clostridiales bacterium]